MTNIIEQMYKEYGVDVKPSKCRGLIHCEECEKSEEINCYKQFEYPPFTAEKQIELIKLISDKLVFRSYILPYANGINHYFVGVEFNKNNHFDKVSETFEGALVKLIIGLKNHLDDSKVKEILQSE